MPKEIAETAKELTLIGWSEEGARNYSNLLNTNNFQIFTSNPYNLTTILIIFFLFLLIYASTAKYLKASDKLEISDKSLGEIKGSNYSKINSKNINKENISNTQITSKFKAKANIDTKNSLIKVLDSLKLLKSETNLQTNSIKGESTKKKTPLNDHLSGFIKETSIDTGKTTEAILTAIIITYDFSRNLIIK